MPSLASVLAPLGSTWAPLGLPWAHPGLLLGPLGLTLGPSWGSLGLCCAPLGRTLAPLGLHLGSSWPHLGPGGSPWVHPAPSGTIFGPLLVAPCPFWDHVGTILEPFWDNFGTILGYFFCSILLLAESLPCWFKANLCEHTSAASIPERGAKPTHSPIHTTSATPLLLRTPAPTPHTLAHPPKAKPSGMRGSALNNMNLCSLNVQLRV